MLLSRLLSFFISDSQLSTLQVTLPIVQLNFERAYNMKTYSVDIRLLTN